MSILDRVETTKATADLPPIKWMILGPAKTGKSTYAASWPKPLVLDMPTERGIWHIPGVDRLPVREWGDIEESIKELRQSAGRWQTVVIDTIDALWALAHDAYNSGKFLQIQDYPKLYRMILDTLDRINGLGVHVVLVSHIKGLTEDAWEDEGGKRKRVKRIARYVNMLPGQLSQRVAGMMDQILHTGVGDDSGYIVRCTNSALYEAGGRVRGLPSTVKVALGQPLYQTILEAYQKSVGKPPTNGKQTHLVNPIKLKAKAHGFTGETLAPWLKLRGHGGTLDTAPPELLAELTTLLEDKDAAALAFEAARAEVQMGPDHQ